MKSETDNIQRFIADFNIIDNALDMRSLRRWNGRKLYDEENLAEHTHLVVACTIKLYDAYNYQILPECGAINFKNCIKLAMLHDACELFRGDILTITKDSIPGLRSAVDDEEQLFYKAEVGFYNKIDWDLVDVADAMACHKFIEYELNYTNNDFVKYVYPVVKKSYENKLEKFLKTYCKYVKDYDAERPIEQRFEKGYIDDAGIDVILDRDVTFLPNSTTVIDLDVQYTPEEGQMGLIFPRTSAASKGINITMCPIDANYTGNVAAIVNNISNDIITYKKGQAFCQLVMVKIIPGTWGANVRKQGKRTDSRMGGTGKC